MKAETQQAIADQFQTFDTSDLIAMEAQTKKDLNMVIRRELAARGMGQRGEWIGFAKAMHYWVRTYRHRP